MAVAPPPPSPVPVPVEPPVETPAPESAQAAAPADALESESRQQLSTIEGVELIEVPRQKRRPRKLFDERIKLSNNVMQKWLTDNRAHTRVSHLVLKESIRRLKIQTDRSDPTNRMKLLLIIAQEHRRPAGLPSANEYLSQPSVKILGKSWGNTLNRFYSRHLPRHIIAPDEFLDVPDFEAEQIMREHRNASVSSVLAQ